MARRKFINAKLKGYNELQEILVEDGVFKKITPCDTSILTAFIALAFISSIVRSDLVSLHLCIPSNNVPVPFVAPCFLAVNT